MIYKVDGRDPESERPVHVEIGWDPETGYFLGIDDERGAEILGKAGIIAQSDVLNDVRAYIDDVRRVTLAVERLQGDDYLSRHPADDPVARMYRAAR